MINLLLISSYFIFVFIFSTLKLWDYSKGKVMNHIILSLGICFIVNTLIHGFLMVIFLTVKYFFLLFSV